MMSTDIGTWVAAIGTLVTFTYLWRSNTVYRVAEHVLLAIAAGHAIVLGFQNVRRAAWEPLTGKGEYALLIPLVLGLLLYTRYVKSLSHLSRIPTAVLIGTSTAMAMRGALQAQLLQQIAATAAPLNSVNSVLILLGVGLTIAYFTYTYKMPSKMAVVPVLGRWVMMIGFGAAFGAAVMGRLSLVIGRFQFLFQEWLGIAG
jgi:hypothetical protein